MRDCIREGSQETPTLDDHLSLLRNRDMDEPKDHRHPRARDLRYPPQTQLLRMTKAQLSYLPRLPTTKAYP